MITNNRVYKEEYSNKQPEENDEVTYTDILTKSIWFLILVGMHIYVEYSKHQNRMHDIGAKYRTGMDNIYEEHQKRIHDIYAEYRTGRTGMNNIYEEHQKRIHDIGAEYRTGMNNIYEKYIQDTTVHDDPESIYRQEVRQDQYQLLQRQIENCMQILQNEKEEVKQLNLDYHNRLKDLEYKDEYTDKYTAEHKQELYKLLCKHQNYRKEVSITQKEERDQLSVKHAKVNKAWYRQYILDNMDLEFCIDESLYNTYAPYEEEGLFDVE